MKFFIIGISLLLHLYSVKAIAPCSWWERIVEGRCVRDFDSDKDVHSENDYHEMTDIVFKDNKVSFKVGETTYEATISNILTSNYRCNRWRPRDYSLNNLSFEKGEDYTVGEFKIKVMHTHDFYSKHGNFYVVLINTNETNVRALTFPWKQNDILYCLNTIITDSSECKKEPKCEKFRIQTLGFKFNQGEINKPPPETKAGVEPLLLNPNPQNKTLEIPNSTPSSEN